MTEERKVGLEEWQESRCQDCGGSGESEVEGGRGEDWHRYIVSCAACGGTGDADAPCVQTCGDIACAVVCKKAVDQLSKEEEDFYSGFDKQVLRVETQASKARRLETALQEVVRVLETNTTAIVDTVWVSGGRPETLLDFCRSALGVDQ